MKSFKQFITEKPQSIKGREKGTTYFSSGETVGGKTPEEAVSAAERDAKKKAAAEARKVSSISTKSSKLLSVDIILKCKRLNKKRGAKVQIILTCP